MEINKDDFYRQDDFHAKYKYKEKDNEKIKGLKDQIRKLKYDIERYERQYPELLSKYNSWLSEKFSMVDLIKQEPWPFKYIFSYTGDDSRVLKEGKEFVKPKDYTHEQKNDLVKEYRDDVIDEMKETILEMKMEIYQLKKELEEEVKIQHAIKEKQKEREKKEIEQAKKEKIKKNAVSQIGKQLEFENDLFDLFSGKKKTKTSLGKTPPKSSLGKTKTTRQTKSIKSVNEHRNKMSEWRSFLEGRKNNVVVKKETRIIEEEVEEMHQMPIKRTKTETKVTFIDLSDEPRDKKHHVVGPIIEELPNQQSSNTKLKGPIIQEPPEEAEDHINHQIVHPPNFEEQASIGTLLLEGPVQQSSSDELSLSLFDEPKKKFYLIPIDQSTKMELKDLAVVIPHNTTKILGRNTWPSLTNNYISREAIEVKNGHEFSVKSLKQKYVTYQSDGKIRNLKNDYINLKLGDSITIMKDVLTLKVVYM